MGVEILLSIMFLMNESANSKVTWFLGRGPRDFLEVKY